MRRALYSDVQIGLKHAQAADDIPAMRASWNQSTFDRLVRAASPDGGFGYRPSARPSPEPTGLACLALHTHVQASSVVEGSLLHLARWQRDNGSVPVSAETPAATWPTAIAILAWHASNRERYDDHIAAARDYLLATKGKTFASDPHIYGHDTTLIGWPWIEQTHTWLEPTSYALLALRAMNLMDHPRVQGALRVIYNRAIPSGGWNYGNPRMFVNELRAFPSTTGIVLAALAGRERDGTVERAIAYLHSELPNVRSPFSLAWGVIGLRCWHALPADVPTWMQSAIARDRPVPPSPLEDALMLIASAEVNPFAPHSQRRRVSLSQTGTIHA